MKSQPTGYASIRLWEKTHTTLRYASTARDMTVGELLEAIVTAEIERLRAAGQWPTHEKARRITSRGGAPTSRITRLPRSEVERLRRIAAANQESVVQAADRLAERELNRLREAGIFPPLPSSEGSSSKT